MKKRGSGSPAMEIAFPIRDRLNYRINIKWGKVRLVRGQDRHLQKNDQLKGF